MYVSTLKLQPGICLKTVFALLLAASASACHCRNARTCPDKQRLIVTTDLGGTDPDDTQSMIHLLVCSNAIDIEGLVSSQVWSDMPDKVDRIHEIVGQFEKVLPRLKKHAEGYPEPGYLCSVIRQGQKTSNMAGVGDGKASPGSELIIEAVDKKEDLRPVWIAAWGGMNTVAQALWTVTHTRSPEDIERFVRKIRIYDVLGQDDAGAWIAKNYPGILYIRNKAVYGWTPSDTWVRENIQSHSPFGKCYPDKEWVFEGDSPSFLYVYANGLNVPEEHFRGMGRTLFHLQGQERARYGFHHPEREQRKPIRSVLHVRQRSRRRRGYKKMATGNMERLRCTHGMDYHKRIFRRQPPSYSHCGRA